MPRILIYLFLVLSVLPVRARAGTPMPPERVLVTDVADGDTIMVLLARRQDTVRLIGVDTPETGRPDTPVQFHGPEASAFTRKHLKGQRVRLEFEDPERTGGQRDKYGRLLAYVFTDDGRNFNLELIRLGHAKAYTRFPFRHLRAFEQAEREARAAGLGLWDRKAREEWADPARRGTVIGNLRTGIYHLPGQQHYGDVREKNRIFFKSEEDAQKAGYRKARN